MSRLKQLANKCLPQHLIKYTFTQQSPSWAKQIHFFKDAIISLDFKLRRSAEIQQLLHLLQMFVKETRKTTKNTIPSNSSLYKN